MTDQKPGDKGKRPKIYKIKLTEVARINPECVSLLIGHIILCRHNPRVLDRFIKGQQSHDNTVLTAVTVGRPSKKKTDSSDVCARVRP